MWPNCAQAKLEKHPSICKTYENLKAKYPVEFKEKIIHPIKKAIFLNWQYFLVHFFLSCPAKPK